METPTTPSVVRELAELGTSIWLDDLSRERLTSGNLAEVRDAKGVVGVTTNPAIFHAAMTSGSAYDADLARAAAADLPAETAVFDLAARDVADACDVFTPVFRASEGVDGRVSIEVDPRLAHDRDATVAQATQLAEAVGRDAVMIKIPATEACLPAISDILAQGISVNVTLIFSVARYSAVIDAFLDGLEAAAGNGHDLSAIHSVASFFISRVDSEIDARLDAIGTPEALELKGTAALANARLAYAAFTERLLASPRWEALKERGAHPQRPLWASTSVKNPDYPDTLYVTELAGPHTVNTMPEATLDALIDHGTLNGDTLSGRAEDATATMSRITEQGVDLADVWSVLETEGVDKFIDAWKDLLDSLDERLAAQRTSDA